MSSTFSIGGLASGFDTEQIIEAMMAVERRGVTLLETRQARANSQLAAFRGLNAKLLAVQSSANLLARSSTFASKTVSVSDETILAATAGSTAAAGSYAVTVTALARAHQLASQGFADTNSTTVGTGDIQIQVGDGETVTVEIDEANNTLDGLRDAINQAEAGVSASILHDGSDAVPYRLLLTADLTGTDNTIAVTANLSGGTAPEFHANAISDVVADDGNTYAGTATSGGSYTGTANRTYLVEIVAGGDLASATYRASEDGGTTWGSTLALAGGTIDVYDDAHGSDLGVDATFTDATFAAGDRFTVDAFVPTVQAAADAELIVGSGAGQIAVTAASNTVTSVLPGVTLELAKADADETVEITIANDTATMMQTVQAFVNNYNSVVDYVREQTRYDTETGQAGILLGNPAVLSIQQGLRNAVLGTVPGLATGSNGLYAVGVSVSATGRLSLDSSELADALDDDIDAVARLFQASGESTHAKIAFVSATSDTRSNAAGYTVQITQAATRGALAGTSIADPAIGGLSIDATNDKLVLEVNGVATSVLSLSHGTYESGTELANEIAAKIAGSDNAVVPVEVVFVDEGATGYLELRTQGYGSGYSVALGENPSNSAASALGLTGATATEGQDVAGTIDGFEADGSGRMLRATDTSSQAQGLCLEVTLEPDEVGTGVDAVVPVVKGVAKQTSDLLDYLTDPVDGYVKSKEDRYNTQLESYAAQIERKEELLAKRRERLVARFVRLEQALSSLQSQSSYLSAQLASLGGLSTQSGQ